MDKQYFLIDSPKKPFIIAKSVRIRIPFFFICEKIELFVAKIHQINGPQIGQDLFLTHPIETVGRSEKNTFVLNDPDISRRHAQFETRGGLYYLKDLGSVNGTFVNGQKITEVLLRNGDEIKIGYTKFFFFLDNHHVPSKGLLKGKQGIPLAKTNEDDESIPTNTLYFSLEQLDFARSAEQQALGYIRDKKTSTQHQLQESPPKLQEVKTRADDHDLIAKYAILFKISDMLIQPMNFNHLLERILELLMEIFPADRSFIFTYDPSNDELLLETQHPKAVNNTPVDMTKMSISFTLLRDVLTKRVSIVTKDASMDKRFASESLHLANIRSAMLTPLIFKDQVFGVIQLDSLKLINAFSPEDLDLFVAVSRQIAVSMHSKRMDEQYLREKNFRDTLSRFHSPDVVEVLFRKGERANLDMENRTCTILFSDVKGFTSLSEKLPPMEIAGLMNEYFTLMAEVVFKFSGTLDKFIGDAVMAIFGAPIQREDDAIRAIKTAVAMQESIHEMNKMRPEESKFHVRIGINTGPCVAGLVGSPQRMEYTVLGDAVNTASRIESSTPPGKIYISEATYFQIKNHFQTQELEPIIAKNKSQPVKIYEILYSL